MGELSPPPHSEHLTGSPTFPLLWITPVVPRAPLLHRPTPAEASPAEGNPLAVTRGTAWLPAARVPRARPQLGCGGCRPRDAITGLSVTLLLV